MRPRKWRPTGDATPADLARGTSFDIDALDFRCSA
jgi:hypothetical protein